MRRRTPASKEFRSGEDAGLVSGRGGFRKGWMRLAAILALTVAGVQTLDLAIKKTPCPASASQFWSYYNALNQNSDHGPVDRVLFSLILVGSE